MAKPIQEGRERSKVDYYDIMVIGKTGMGKSTTVDKMLAANPGGLTEQRTQHVHPGNNKKVQYEDLTMWLVSAAPFDPEQQDYHDNSFLKVSLRLKNLVFFKSVENPHLKINRSRESGMSIYESTVECE